MGEQKGTRSDRKIIKRLLNEGSLYQDAVYLLTHVKIKNPYEAKNILKNIICHRNFMVKKLERNVSIQVATLDYLQNVKNILKKPTIIELDKAYCTGRKSCYR